MRPYNVQAFAGPLAEQACGCIDSPVLPGLEWGGGRKAVHAVSPNGMRQRVAIDGDAFPWGEVVECVIQCRINVFVP